jgi:alanine racemase
VTQQRRAVGQRALARQTGDRALEQRQLRRHAARAVGIVACGYADGYPRVAPGTSERGTPVLVDGVRTRTVGRVSMDMLAVDLAPVPSANTSSEVVLWGRSERGTLLSIDEVALACGTLGYELMCARAPRVPVRVVP